jgi:inosine-uridine preferring nucleoside hydrolase
VSEGSWPIRRRRRAPIAGARLRIVLLLCAVSAVSFSPHASGAGGISFHGSYAAQYASDSTTSLRLNVPTGAQAGDVLIASLGFGSSAAGSQPTLTAPAGWTLVTKTNRDPVATLAVYEHVLAAGETSYTWTTSIPVGGAVFLSAFAGIDGAVDAASGQALTATSTPSTPSLTTTAAGDLVLASFYGYRGNALGGSWTPPTGMSEIGDTSNGGSRSGTVDYAVQPDAGSTGAKAATASAAQDYAITALVALKPASTSASATGIAFHGAISATYPSESTTSLHLNVPAGAAAGDVLIASLGFGSSVATSQPILAAPSGWTLVSKTNRDPTATLAVYQHVLAAGETGFTWTTSIPVGGAIFLSAFGGVDTTNPVDTFGGQVVTATGAVAAPSVTTTGANELLLASYFAYKSGAVGTSWSPPSGMAEIGDAHNGGSRSGTIDYGAQATAGATGPETATASSSQDYAIGALVALRPTASPPPPPPPSTGGIAFHGATKASYASDSTTSLRLDAPSAAVPGDVLVASLGFGSSSATSQPTLTAPAGWTLVSQTNKDSVGALAVYQHVFAAGETSYTWPVSRSVGGAAFLAAFAGIDTATPVDTANGQVLLSTGSVSAPTLTTTTAGDLLLSGFYGYHGNALGDSWTPPSGMAELGDTSNLASRSGSVDYAVQDAAGSTGTKTATASGAQDYAIATLVALRPAGAPPPPPPPTPPTPAGPATIAFHGATQTAYASDSTSSLRLAPPTGAETGDVLIASLGFGSSSATTQPTLTAPAGWTLVVKTNRDPVGTLAVYRHVFTAGETAYTWTTNRAVGGTIFLAAFAGLDPSNPVDAANGQTLTATSSATAPAVTTAAGDLLLGSFYGHRNNSTSGSWTPPSGMTEVADLHNGGSRSGSVAYAVQAAAGSTGTKTATASASQDYTIASLVALRPGTAAPLAVTIDTDMFSSPDDAEGLAIAFALQMKNEAKVIAIGVSTRDSRALTPGSWKCVAAIAQFYNSGNVPIGVDPPPTGSAVNDPDIVGPCARLAAPSTPDPDTAVNVYRRALSAQPDGSVVMISTGYLENLANLLKSPADSISPLGGRDLVARKVQRLVVMGGGYPSRSGETNLTGYASAAQYVADNWPTKLVWSGYEVGDAVTTGQTISSVHPTWSPVRAAYEALIRPGNWYYSYDLTAVYHAIRPGDANLVETGPGKNTVDSVGGNIFTAGAGNQYYLRLGSATALSSTLEDLLDALPGATSSAATP